MLFRSAGRYESLQVDDSMQGLESNGNGSGYGWLGPTSSVRLSFLIKKPLKSNCIHNTPTGLHSINYQQQLIHGRRRKRSINKLDILHLPSPQLPTQPRLLPHQLHLQNPTHFASGFLWGIHIFLHMETEAEREHQPRWASAEAFVG